MQPDVQVGSYRVLQQIGEGGMGSVWVAQHTMLGRRAAIKVLHAELSSRQDIVTRFFNEARAATAIADPGIVQVFDFGHHTDGSAYIVMELLDGEALSRRLERLGRLPLGDALRIMRQVASSVGAAHARGIVHRDLKPENIYLVRDLEVPGGERAKILDFGIAKLAGDPAGVKTQTSLIMGTPTYMSPEQCRGAGHVDQRSDVYALGCVLFTLIAGGPPFHAEGTGELISMHIREQAPRLSSRASGVPPVVDELVAHCLEKSPARRYASGTDLASALGALVSQHTGSTPMPAFAFSSIPEVPGTTLSGSAVSLFTAPARRRGRLVVASVSVALVGAIAFVALGNRAPAGGGDAPGQLSRGSAATALIAPPDPPATLVAQPAPDAARPSDKGELARLHIRTVLIAFADWTSAHAGAPCPSANDLASSMGDAHAVDDPWGHPVAITCTDQPADQVIGAISAGADGQFKTDDDIASWTLGHEVTGVVAGARWVPAPVKRRVSTPPRNHAEPPAASKNPLITRPATGSNDDGIPTTR